MNNMNVYSKQLGYLNCYSDKTAKDDQGDKRLSGTERLGTAMTAAALQQHLSLSLGLTTNKKPGGGKKKNRVARKPEEEYVLEEKPPPPTLAQRYGLAEPPASILTEGEWAQVKQQSLGRGDNAAPCVICKEEFGLGGQVLLSCSHLFHKACLKAFERYSGRKTCPMCRKEQYETRIIHDGAKRHKHVSAVRIQAAWRGYLARKWYSGYRERNPPTDPLLRAKYFEKKLTGLTGKMVDMVNSSSAKTDQLFSDIDADIARSRRVMQTANLLSADRISSDKWNEIHNQMLKRNDKDCPICIGSLWSKRRPTTMLSCSHLYHTTCIEMFEKLTTETNLTCPVCRCDYIKKPCGASLASSE